MSEKIYKCRFCGQLIRDNTGGFFVTKEDLSVCQECRKKAKPAIGDEKPIYR